MPPYWFVEGPIMLVMLVGIIATFVERAKSKKGYGVRFIQVIGALTVVPII